MNENLIEEVVVGSSSTNNDDEALIPDLSDPIIGNIQEEPDYSSMDNLTLLSSLNLHESTNNDASNEQNLLNDLIN